MKSAVLLSVTAALAVVEAALDAAVEAFDFAGLQRDLHNRAADHPVVREHLAQWSDCMKAKGHPFTEVWEPTLRYGNLDVTKKQIRVAVDDVECTRSSAWADYYYAALADYQQQAIDLDPELFERMLDSERARLGAVRRETARS